MATEVKEGIQNRSGEDGVATRRVLSNNNIETLDLICEGEIGGLTSGEWIFSGQQGEIGWRRATFSAFSGLPGTTGQGWLRSVYWNEVPVLSSLGKANFQRVDVSYSVGTPNGDLVNQNSPELTISRSIAERLRASEVNANGEPESEDTDFAKVYRIFNKQCTAAIINVKTPNLAKTVTIGDFAGNTNPTTVEYWIYYRPMFNAVNQGPGQEGNFRLAIRENITGKVNYGYIRATRIDFDGSYADRKDFLGWEIKIVRVTPDSLQGSLRNQTYVDSITEVYTSSYLYPNSAIVRSNFSAEYFQRVPSRAFDAHLLKVKIPSTYDPILRTYTEGPQGWDGTFKEEKEWTDNPIWCYYDLLTNPRYGLGKYMPEAMVDKWSLYEASKYCDVLVPDGYGNLEPRFTANLLINSREEAYKVINDMASIFRAVTYYGAGAIYASQDAPKEAVVQFTNANVEEGDFTYSTSAKKGRHSVAIVRYNDPTNFFKPAVEYVEDIESIRRYGIRETEITAFGCTSRGQAIRLGRWALLTENKQTETVSFTAGLEAHYLRPGDVFKVFDSNKKTTRNAGRTVAIENGASTANIVLDRAITLSTGTRYTLSVLTPGYFYNPASVDGLNSTDASGIRNSLIQNFTITGVQTTGYSGSNSLIRLYERLNDDGYATSGNLVWTLEMYSGEAEKNAFIYDYWDYYQAINIVEKEENKYEVVGLQYSIRKFDEIESGLSFQRDEATYRVRPEHPSALELNLVEKTQNTKVIDYSFTVDNYTGVSSYRVYAKKNEFTGQAEPENAYLIANLPVDVQEESYLPTEEGKYYFRVYSVNDELNLASTGFASGDVLVEDINPIRDVIISSLQLETGVEITNDAGYRDTVVYEGDSPMFLWQAGYAQDSSVASDLTYRITVRPPSTSNVPNSTVLYEVTGYTPENQDLSWEFDIDTNDALTDGPYRNYDVVVEAMNSELETSAGNIVGSIDNQYTNNPFGYDILSVYNPIPSGIYMTDMDGSNQYDNGYHSTGYLTENGAIVVAYDSGVFDEDIVGGYIWATKAPVTVDQLTSGHAIQGFRTVNGFQWPIRRIEFAFDPTADVHTIHVANPYGSIATESKIAISFFDRFDKLKKDNGNPIYQDLWISEFVRIRQNADVAELKVTQGDYPTTDSSLKSVKMDIQTGMNESYKFMLTSASGDPIIISSFQ